MSLVFDAKKALDYTQAMARPRMVGTAEEKAAASELGSQLEGFGYRVVQEPFHFWNASICTLNSYISFAVLFAGLGSMGLLPCWVSALGLVALFVTVPTVTKAAESVALFPETHGSSLFSRGLRRLGMVYSSANLVAELPNVDGQPPRKHLYLVAHYDSKSQPLPITVRAVLFMALIAASLAFILFGLLASVFGFLGLPAFLSGLVVIAAGVPLLLNNVGNKSPGAIDNASGVGVVAHLAELMSQSPDLRQRLRWTILLTGAEELSLMGAAAFVRRHAGELSGVPDVHFLNFDGVGVAGRLYYDARGGPSRTGELVRHTEAAARARGISIAPLKFLGALFDHIPLSRRGLDALSLLAIGKASRTIHTRHDVIDRLDPRGFEQAGNLAVEIIERLAVS